MSEQEEYQYIGTISSPNGFNGKINLKDIPEGIEKIKNNSQILCGYSPKFSKKFTLVSFSLKQHKAVVALKEIKTDKQVFDLKENGLFTHVENLIKREKQELTDDIIGVKVYNVENDELLGEVIDVWYLPGNDVWLTKTSRGDLPIPVTDEVIKFQDIKAGIIKINLIDGLWDLIQ